MYRNSSKGFPRIKSYLSEKFWKLFVITHVKAWYKHLPMLMQLKYDLFNQLYFPGGSVIKEPVCQHRRCKFDPWVGKIPWRRKWQPTPVFLPEKSHGQRNLVGYSPWGCEKLDMTEWLSTDCQVGHTHGWQATVSFSLFSPSFLHSFSMFLSFLSLPLFWFPAAGAEWMH